MGRKRSPSDEIPHRHLIQSPYNTPILPALHADQSREQPVESALWPQTQGKNCSDRRSQSETPPKSPFVISSPLPTGPFSPSDMNRGNSSVNDTSPPQMSSYQTTASSLSSNPSHNSAYHASSTTDRAPHADPRKPSKNFPKRFTSALKGLFTRDTQDEHNVQRIEATGHWTD